MSFNQISERICVLASGGVDSSLLIQSGLNEGKRIFPLYVRCGFIWENAEQRWLERLLGKLRHPSLEAFKVFSCDFRPFLPQHFGVSGKNVPDAGSPDASVYIPERNLLLTTAAALECEAQNCSEIWIGTLKDNPFSDGHGEFFRAQARAFSIGLGRPLTIRNPFGLLSKQELIQKFPDFPLRDTFSCLRPKGNEHCGACNKCEERNKVLKNASLRKTYLHLR